MNEFVSSRGRFAASNAADGVGGGEVNTTEPTPVNSSDIVTYIYIFWIVVKNRYIGVIESNLIGLVFKVKNSVLL